MGYEESITFAKLAFFTADFEKAIEHSEEARKCDPKNPEVYELLAKSYQALRKPEQAIESFKKAIECDLNNGNRYVELGLAYGGNGDPIKALETFAKAESLGCDDEYRGGMYRTLAMADYELGRYEDAIVNYSKAQEYLEPDIELLMHKALACSMAGRLGKAVAIVNQLKQLAPASYYGYNLAYTFFKHLDKYEDAENELRRAAKWVNPLPMEFYFDSADLAQSKYRQDQNRDHLLDAILFLDKGIRTAKPGIGEVVNAYLDVADICIQVEQFSAAVGLLKAAENPVYSFNNGFSVVPWIEKPEIESPLTEDFIRNSAYQEYDVETLNEMAEQAAAREQSGEEFLTPVPEDEAEPYQLDKNEPISYDEDIRDRINLLYIGAYTGLKDYKNCLKHAQKVRNSSSVQTAHIGHYLEAKAYADLGDEQTEQKYEELIAYYRRAVVRDPSDIAAVTYRVQCYIDLKRYDEALAFCRNLSKSMKEPLLKQIHDAQHAVEEQ